MIVSNLLKRVTKSKKLWTLPIRGIKLHEYQSAKLLSTYGVPVPYVIINFRFKFLIHISFYRAM